MLPPLTKEEYEQLVPQHVKDLDGLPIPLIPGIQVFDVLHAGKYSANSSRGIVKTVSKDGTGVTVDFLNSGGSCGSSASYWVPDTRDATTASYVEAWKAGASLPPFISRCSCGNAGKTKMGNCPFQVEAFDKTQEYCVCCDDCEMACARKVEWVLNVLRKTDE